MVSPEERCGAGWLRPVNRKRLVITKISIRLSAMTERTEPAGRAKGSVLSANPNHWKRIVTSDRIRMSNAVPRQRSMGRRSSARYVVCLPASANMPMTRPDKTTITPISMPSIHLRVWESRGFVSPSVPVFRGVAIVNSPLVAVMKRNGAQSLHLDTKLAGILSLTGLRSNMTLDRRSLNCTFEILTCQLAIQTADAIWRGIPDCKSSRWFVCSIPEPHTCRRFSNRQTETLLFWPMLHDNSAPHRGTSDCIP